MPLQVQLICLLEFIFLLLLPPPTTSTITRKPDCPSRCGDVSIPYPFGVGSDCSLEASFNITCNTSTIPHKPYLNINRTSIEIVEIGVDNPPQIRIKYPYLLDGACFNKTSGNRTWRDSNTISLSGTQYTVSDENWLTGIGCDDLLMVTTFIGNQTFRDACLGTSTATMTSTASVTSTGSRGSVAPTTGSLTSTGSRGRVDPMVDPKGSGTSTDHPTGSRGRVDPTGRILASTDSVTSTGSGACPNNENGNSVGDGCCRIPIPKGSDYVSTNLISMSLPGKSERLYPCSYGFITEKGISNEPGFSYNFSLLTENGTAIMSGSPTVVRLDWRIGAENCSLARRNSSTFACQDNTTECVDFGHNVQGYLCNCSQGYVGNPYLHQGCKDINECGDNPCGPNSDCINTPGSYDCLCRRGYTGDGKSPEKGCTRSSPLPTMIKVVLIGLASVLGLLVLFLVWSWMHKVLQKRKNRKRKEDLFKHLLFQQRTNEETFAKTKLFAAKELEKATDYFNKSRICGRGGQGIVYKGMLSDGMIVAIKKLKQVDENEVEQFITEVVILSQINHKNVVKLLGCCLETEVPLLVYEYLPNGTLYDLIRVPNLEFPLTWKMRLKIAADVAGAVAYLHFSSATPIYHRDIKSTNILLDEKNVVKVSDFGTSKFVQEDQTHLTTLVKGTIGYLDPEYFATSQYTEKSDVYSFGVVLVELLTGQQPIFFQGSEVHKNLATLFLDSMEANNLDAILDTRVCKEGAKEEVIAFARLAKRCLHVRGIMRPTMKEVAAELEYLRISQIPSSLNDELEETRARETKPMMMISDIEYTWTISDHSVASSSSDAHPFLSSNV